jgi:hypothetical protein
VEVCFIDLGKTAETVVRDRLSQKQFNGVLIGAGVRTNPKYFILFEKLINAVHAHAPQAKLCCNTKPSDSAEAFSVGLDDVLAHVPGPPSRGYDKVGTREGVLSRYVPVSLQAGWVKTPIG